MDWKKFGLLLLAAGLVVGCGDEDDDSGKSEANDEITEWQGSAVHLRVEGALGEDEPTALSLNVGSADAGVLYCERNYIVPDADNDATYNEGFLEKVELKYEFDFEGQPAELEVELADLDYDNFVAPVNGLVAGSANASDRNLNSINVEAKLKINPDTAEEEELEASAVTGTVDFELLTGSPNGLIIADNEGQMGGYLNVGLSDGNNLVMSFTVDCGENDIESEE